MYSQHTDNTEKAFQASIYKSNFSAVCAFLASCCYNFNALNILRWIFLMITHPHDIWVNGAVRLCFVGVIQIRSGS